MTLRSRGWLAGALLMGLALTGNECRAAMTLQFNIQPLTQPSAGSLTQESDGTLRATNLAVTSVSSVSSTMNNGATMALTKYLDFQSGGTGGVGVANFFVLDSLAEVAQGTTPTTFTSITGAQKLLHNLDGSYLFTMQINYGYVGDAIINNFGTAADLGWTGLLTLNIAKFDPYMASAQVTSGTVVLTSLVPVPAGQEITPSVVPEPASCIMAGLGLLVVAGCRTRLRRIAA